MKITREYIISALSIIIAAILLYLTCRILRDDQETNGALEINHSEIVFSEDDIFLSPSKMLTKPLIIKNRGLSSVHYRVYLELQTEGVTEDIIINIFQDDVLLFSQAMVKFNGDSPFISPKTISNREEHLYRMEIIVLDTAGNEYIDKTIQFDIIVEVAEKLRRSN